MKNADLKIGDKVMLSEDSEWTNMFDSNPRKTLGEIIEGVDNNWVRVEWSNGKTNAYRSSDSDLILQNPKITKDCFVNVKDWTDEEVLEAAKIFVESVEGARPLNMTWLDTDIEGYDYLLVLQDGEVFVGNSGTLSLHNRYKELTKEDFFGKAQLPSIHITFNPDDVQNVQSLIDTLETNIKMKYDHTEEKGFKVGDKVIVKDLPNDAFKGIGILYDDLSGRELTVRGVETGADNIWYDFHETPFGLKEEFLMPSNNLFNNTDFLIEQINNAYENLQNSKQILDEAQQQVENHKEAYESAVKALQDKVGDKGFKIEPVGCYSTFTQRIPMNSRLDIEEGSTWQCVSQEELTDITFGNYYKVKILDDSYEMVDIIDDALNYNEWGFDEFLKAFRKVDRKVTPKKFDRYSYWDVSEWTKEEIEEAADILAEEFGVEVSSITTPPDYHFLLITNDEGVFVGSYGTVDSIGDHLVNKRSKKDILGYSN